MIIFLKKKMPSHAILFKDTEITFNFTWMIQETSTTENCSVYLDKPISSEEEKQNDRYLSLHLDEYYYLKITLSDGFMMHTRYIHAQTPISIAQTWDITEQQWKDPGLPKNEVYKKMIKDEKRQILLQKNPQHFKGNTH